MKKIIFALVSALTVSALTGCGNDPEDVALGMVKAIVNGDAEKAASTARLRRRRAATSRTRSLPSSSTERDWPQ